MNGFQFEDAGTDVTFTFVGKASGMGAVMYLILFAMLCALGYFVGMYIQSAYLQRPNEPRAGEGNPGEAPNGRAGGYN